MGKKISLFLCAAVFLAALSGCSGSRETTAEGSGFYFDTEISIQVTAEHAEELLEECFALCGQMEKTFSRTREDSELYQVNHRNTDEVLLSEDLAAVVEAGIAFYDLSGGKLDITIGPLCEIWDFSEEKNVPPSAQDIQEALAKVDGTSIWMEDRTLHFERRDTVIDLGALAKGYISDRLKSYLDEAGAKSALINLGGNVMTLGARPDGKPWTVGIQKPFAARGVFEKTVSVEDKSVISSGIYERYFEYEGNLYYHILDPATGYPAEVTANQVTIISDSGLLGDALSTACLMMEQDAAQELAAQFPGTELIV